MAMKILQAIHDFLPDHRAGSEIYTYHLSRALRERGHEVSLLFTEKRLERPQFEVTRGEYDDLPFHEVVYNRHFHDVEDLYDDARMEAPIGSVLDRVAPDVVHVQSLVYLGLSLLRAAAARRIPLVMTLHEYFAVCPRGGLLLNLQGELCDPIVPAICARCIAPYPMTHENYPDRPDGEGAGHDELGSLRFQARAIDVRRRRMFEGLHAVSRFVAPSRFLAERLVREGLERDKVVVADYGFPPPVPRPRCARAPGEPLRLGFLGTLSDYKGVHVAVDAMAQLPAGTATLRIKGEPSWFPDYTTPLIERAAVIEGVTFEGPIPHGSAPEFFAELDALVVPSLWVENSPLTIHEAFQCGVPVLTTALGGMAELVETGGGETFARGDHEELARVIERLAEEPGRLDALVSSIPIVKSIDVNADEMESIYDAVITRENV